jgi:hypothetical protein
MRKFLLVLDAGFVAADSDGGAREAFGEGSSIRGSPMRWIT